MVSDTMIENNRKSGAPVQSGAPFSFFQSRIRRSRMLSGLAASGEAAVAAQFVDVNQSADAANAASFPHAAPRS